MHIYESRISIMIESCSRGEFFRALGGETILKTEYRNSVNIHEFNSALIPIRYAFPSVYGSIITINLVLAVFIISHNFILSICFHVFLKIIFLLHRPQGTLATPLCTGTLYSQSLFLSVSRSFSNSVGIWIGFDFNQSFDIMASSYPFRYQSTDNETVHLKLSEEIVSNGFFQ